MAELDLCAFSKTSHCPLWISQTPPLLWHSIFFPANTPASSSFDESVERVQVDPFRHLPFGSVVTLLGKCFSAGAASTTFV